MPEQSVPSFRADLPRVSSQMNLDAYWAESIIRVLRSGAFSPGFDHICTLQRGFHYA